MTFVRLYVLVSVALLGSLFNTTMACDRGASVLVETRQVPTPALPFQPQIVVLDRLSLYRAGSLATVNVNALPGFRRRVVVRTGSVFPHARLLLRRAPLRVRVTVR